MNKDARKPAGPPVMADHRLKPWPSDWIPEPGMMRVYGLEGCSKGDRLLYVPGQLLFQTWRSPSPTRPQKVDPEIASGKVTSRVELVEFMGLLLFGTL